MSKEHNFIISFFSLEGMDGYYYSSLRRIRTFVSSALLLRKPTPLSASDPGPPSCIRFAHSLS